MILDGMFFEHADLFLKEDQHILVDLNFAFLDLRYDIDFTSPTVVVELIEYQTPSMLVT
jgi:hypothetical protein